MVDRLKRRPPEALAAFIVSLAQETGPVGDQVRTFIGGDDVNATVEALTNRMRSLDVPSEYAYRHARGGEIGQHLDLILDSIETLVMPVAPRKSFDLLILFFEADLMAMENGGDHHWEVECAFTRAAAMLAEASKAVPSDETIAALRALTANDGYGIRGDVTELLKKMSRET